jgi:hypothetical protein
LLSVLDPFFERWKRQLETGIAEHLDYIALHIMLAAKLQEPEEACRVWLRRVRLLSSVREELEYIFIYSLRKMNRFPERARPYTVEYIISQRFRNYLEMSIEKAWRHRSPVVQTEEACYYLECPDYLLLSNLHLSPRDSYLLYLLQQNMNSVERGELVHLHRFDLYHKERPLWQRLGLTQSDK